jgi:hypothetical protein
VPGPNFAVRLPLLSARGARIQQRTTDPGSTARLAVTFHLNRMKMDGQTDADMPSFIGW